MSIHKPVLLQESIDGLNLKKGSIVVDATLGGGGHSEGILRMIGEEGRLIAIDIDKRSIEEFENRIRNKNKETLENKNKGPLAGKNLPFGGNRVTLVNDNFVNLKSILENLDIRRVDAILADLGYSSDQLEDPDLGLSFQKDAPLDMRLGRGGQVTASEVINGYSQEELIRVLREFGEERQAARIARKVIEARKAGPIRTTGELAEIVYRSVPAVSRNAKIHPATKTFQALRIEVNEELENLRKFSADALDLLGSDGRLGIISFHSLEDRIVKNFLRENARGCICPKDFPECLCGHRSRIRIITKKPITPSPEEIRSNPRARSAKLRIGEKI